MTRIATVEESLSENQKELEDELKTTLPEEAKQEWWLDIVALMVVKKMAKSRTEAKRLMKEGAVEMTVILKPPLRFLRMVRGEYILKVGRDKWLRIVVKP